MYDTTRPESMPPLRNAPSGTSLSSRSCTAGAKRGVDVVEQLALWPMVGVELARRPSTVAVSSRPFATRSQCPGTSL